jgi:hypothetical protein
MKPKIFIGSSTAGLHVAELIQKELAHEGAPVLWSQGVFRDINVPIEDLMAAVETYDFAVFVLLPEDTVAVRDQEAFSVRDNVIFELGLFLGKLGRARNFFISPVASGGMKSRLPSDLAGITPAKYDPKAESLQASVGTALYQLKQTIRNYTARSSAKTIYETGEKVRPYDFATRESTFYKDDKPSSPKGTGEIEFTPNGIIKLKRTNQDGRFEIELRQNGKSAPSIDKSQSLPRRILRVSCDAKVDKGEQVVRFVLKDIKKGKWEADKKLTVACVDWQPLELFFEVSPAADLLFRIDVEKPSIASSTLSVRHLLIAEET